MSDVRYHRSAERPALKLWLFDDDGVLIDLSSGWTFAFKVGRVGQAAVLNKTTSIVGAVGSGQEPSGVPNVVVTWAAAELDFAVGIYDWQLVCTNTGLNRTFGGIFKLLGVIL